MDPLEKIIKQNRNSFDTAEPADGHFERFTSRLANRRTKRSFSLPNILKVASVAVLIILSSLWTYDNLIIRRNADQGMSLSEVSPEYQEVELYYTSLVNTKYDEIDHLKFPEDSIQKQILRKELSNMDFIYSNLKKELVANPTDERIINAIIEHYELKIEVMNQILVQLKQLNNQKTNNTTDHESTDV